MRRIRLKKFANNEADFRGSWKFVIPYSLILCNSNTNTKPTAVVRVYAVLLTAVFNNMYRRFLICRHTKSTVSFHTKRTTTVGGQSCRREIIRHPQDPVCMGLVLMLSFYLRLHLSGDTFPSGFPTGT
jgi:hypothetical protein